MGFQGSEVKSGQKPSSWMETHIEDKIREMEKLGGE